MNIIKCHLIFTMEPAIHLWVKRKFYFVSAPTHCQTLIAAICKFSIKTTCLYIRISYTPYTIYDIRTHFSSFDGIEFHETNRSKYYHSETFGLGNYRGNPFTVGSSPKSYGDDWKYFSRKTEIFIWIIWIGPMNRYLIILSPQIPSKWLVMCLIIAYNSKFGPEIWPSRFLNLFKGNLSLFNN